MNYKQLFRLLMPVILPLFTIAQMPVRITPEGLTAYDPDWSPSGDTLSFTSVQSGNQHIYILPVSGGDLVAMTSGASENIHSRWSPAGGWIAFSSDRTGDQELWSVHLSNGLLVNLTNHPASEESLDFSPGGELFWFNSNRSSGNWDIWQQPTGGGTPVRITTEPGNDGEPALSPDGTRIAFISSRNGHMDIWVMNSDGTDPYPLTNDEALDILPCWSSDGTLVTFVSNRNGNFDIFSIAASGGELTPLLSSLQDESYPAWSPDGQYLCFSAAYDGTDAVYLLPVLQTVPSSQNVHIDGMMEPGEWDKALQVKLFTAGRIIPAWLMHDGEALLLAFDLKNTLPGADVRFPEILLDPSNDHSAGWQSDDWWFHISATDCYFQGNHSNYSRCDEDHPDWDALPNFSTTPGARPVDTIEIRIPFETIGVTISDTIGLAIDVTNTANAWEYWPLGGEIGSPATWGAVCFEHPVTGDPSSETTPQGSNTPNPCRFYPNPASDQLTMTCSFRDPTPVLLAFSDFLGRELWTRSLTVPASRMPVVLDVRNTTTSPVLGLLHLSAGEYHWSTLLWMK